MERQPKAIGVSEKRIQILHSPSSAGLATGDRKVVKEYSRRVRWGVSIMAMSFVLVRLYATNHWREDRYPYYPALEGETPDWISGCAYMLCLQPLVREPAR